MPFKLQFSPTLKQIDTVEWRRQESKHSKTEGILHPNLWVCVTRTGSRLTPLISGNSPFRVALANAVNLRTQCLIHEFTRWITFSSFTNSDLLNISKLGKHSHVAVFCYFVLLSSTLSTPFCPCGPLTLDRREKQDRKKKRAMLWLDYFLRIRKIPWGNVDLQCQDIQCLILISSLHRTI